MPRVTRAVSWDFRAFIQAMDGDHLIEDCQGVDTGEGWAEVGPRHATVRRHGKFHMRWWPGLGDEVKARLRLRMPADLVAHLDGEAPIPRSDATKAAEAARKALELAVDVRKARSDRFCAMARVDVLTSEGQAATDRALDWLTCADADVKHWRSQLAAYEAIAKGGG